MKQLFLVLILATLAFGVQGQQEEPILIGKKVTFFSQKLNENRKIWIYTPDKTSLHPGEETRYPVLYLLDGEAHFYSTVGLIQQLSQANLNSVLPEMIVVGIENTNRLRDLTPRSTEMGTTARNTPFVHFLSSELIPYIDKNYNTAPYKVLVGHSLGGLMAIDMLTQSPQLFNAYLAIDPSMWYDNEQFLQHTMAQVPKNNLSGTKLFIGAANTLPKGMSLSKLPDDKSPETQHVRSILKLDKFLKSNTGSGLTYAYKYYEKESHISVPLISEYDGLKFIFDYYLLDATEKDFADSSALIAVKLKKHYDNVTREMGYKIAPPETFIHYLSYEAFSKQQFSKAEALYQFNIDNYPNSPAVYDAYGDFLMAKRDTTKAFTFYKKSLRIKEDETVRNKLHPVITPPLFRLSADELQQYAGVYRIEAYQVDIVLEVRDGVLWSKVPGQEDSAFVPVSKDVFSIKDKQGYSIAFQMENKRAVAFTSKQPNGTFYAVLRRD